MDYKASFKKLKEFDWAKFFGSKAFLIGGCAVIIVAAIVVNALIPVNEPAPQKPAGNAQILGNSVLAGVDTTLEDEEEVGYFEQAVIQRENTRNEAMDVLKAIADNPDSLADAKEQAIQSIAAMAEEMNAEAAIEQLIKAKGFEKCVCIVSDGKANVVVSSESELTPAQTAQVLEIVFTETGIEPAQTKLMVMSQSAQKDA